MRWNEIAINEKLKHAMPLRARADSHLKKALPLITTPAAQLDPAQALAQAVPQIYQASAAASQQAAQQAVALDDAEEALAAQQSRALENIKNKQYKKS